MQALDMSPKSAQLPGPPELNTRPLCNITKNLHTICERNDADNLATWLESETSLFSINRNIVLFLEKVKNNESLTYKVIINSTLRSM